MKFDLYGIIFCEVNFIDLCFVLFSDLSLCS